MEEGIVTYHEVAVLPLYNLPFHIVVGDEMMDVIAHGESIFPGASLTKAFDYDHYTCKMTHPDKKTRYMILIETMNEINLAAVCVKVSTELSWYLMEEVKIECNETNNKSQSHIVMALFILINETVKKFLNEKESGYNNSDNDMGEL